jgi:GTP cyclohydrolase II
LIVLHGAAAIPDSAGDPAIVGPRPPVTPADRDSLVLESRDGVTSLADAALPTRYGDFRIRILRVDDLGTEAIVLCRGRISGDDPILTRVHSECLTSEVLGSLRCDCAEQLAAALARIGAAERGLLIYLRQEGRGIGLVNKIRAYALQDRGLDTVDANLALGLPVDGREYWSAVKVLTFLGARRVRLLTNNPAKARALQRQGIDVVERVPLEVAPNPINRTYLQAKAARLGHLLTIDLSEGLGVSSPADGAVHPESLPDSKTA